jgi:hypothetical protein
MDAKLVCQTVGVALMRSMPTISDWVAPGNKSRSLASCIYNEPVWYSLMSSFMSSFTTSIAKQPTLCLTLWSASLKTHSHRVKYMVKLQKHGSLPRSWRCSLSCFLKNSSTGKAELCQTGPINPGL